MQKYLLLLFSLVLISKCDGACQNAGSYAIDVCTYNINKQTDVQYTCINFTAVLEEQYSSTDSSCTNLIATTVILSSSDFIIDCESDKCVVSMDIYDNNHDCSGTKLRTIKVGVGSCLNGIKCDCGGYDITPYCYTYQDSECTISHGSTSGGCLRNVWNNVSIKVSSNYCTDNTECNKIGGVAAGACFSKTVDSTYYDHKYSCLNRTHALLETFSTSDGSCSNVVNTSVVSPTTNESDFLCYGTNCYARMVYKDDCSDDSNNYYVAVPLSYYSCINDISCECEQNYDDWTGDTTYSTECTVSDSLCSSSNSKSITKLNSCKSTPSGNIYGDYIK